MLALLERRFRVGWARNPDTVGVLGPHGRETQTESSGFRAQLAGDGCRFP